MKLARDKLLTDLLAKYQRVGITGAPGTGKSTLAAQALDLGLVQESEVFACDVGLPRAHGDLVEWVVDNVPSEGRVLVEGCALPWALRAGVKLDAVLVLTRRHEELASNQRALAAGVETVLAEVLNDGTLPVLVREEPVTSITLSCMGDIGGQVTAAQYVAALTPDVTDVTVLINSPGGDAFEGFAIYNALAQHPAKVVVNIVGLCASAASFIAMAGDEVNIAANGVMMIHEASGGAYGGADALDAQAAALRKINTSMAGIYAARTGRDVSDIEKMLASGDHYMTATEAKAEGFVTAVIPDKVPEANLRALKPDQLKGAPAAFLAAVHAALTPPLKKDRDPMNIDQLVADLAALTPDQRSALVKHADSNSKLKDLFVTPELTAQAALAGRFTAVLGKDGESALGAVAALQASESRAAALEARCAELESDKNAREINDLLVASANKVTPAMREGIMAKYTAKVLSAEAVKAMVEVLPVIPGTRVVKQPTAQVASALTYKGKAYAELKPSEKHALHLEDPELFAAMSAARS